MKKIKLISEAGERWIIEGLPFRFLPGERIAEDANGNAITTTNNFKDLVTPEGIMIGNVIKTITSALGIKQCMKCKRRQERFNDRGLEIQAKVKEFFHVS